MAARVQIVVEAKDASSGVLRAITGQLGAFGGLMEELTSKNVNWGNVTERALTMVIDGVRDAIRVTQEYTEDVRDQTLASGQSAEAASRFLQVLDDYQLTAEDAKTATRALTREGLAPTVDTLIELSKQYNALTTAEEKNAFVQKNLGRAGQEWLNLLSQGPEKIKAMNDAVNQGLILTDRNVEAYEEYRLALDEWNDAVMAAKVNLGTSFLPVLTDMMEGAARGAELTRVQAMQLTYLNDALKDGTISEEQYKAKLEEFNLTAYSAIEKTEQLKNATGELGEAVTEVDYKSLISSIQSAQNEMDRYTEKHDDLIAKKQELLAKIEDLKRKGYREEGQTIQDVRGDLSELDKQLDDNAKAHQKWAAQTVFSFAQARAAADGNITKGEGEMLIQIGEQLDLYDKKTAETMRSVNEAFDALDTSNARDTVKTLEDSLMKLTGKRWVIKIATDTSGVNIPSSTGNNAGMPDYYQSGGTVYAGNPVTVGEAGPEPFIPPVNGRILGHAESLHALSLGGSNMYFYGNVSIAPDSQGGGDLLNIR